MVRPVVLHGPWVPALPTAQTAEGFHHGLTGNTRTVHRSQSPTEEVTLSSTLTLSDTYETAVDALRDVGDRVSWDLPSGLVPSNLPRPDDLLERVAEESRRVGKKQLLISGGAVALVLAIVWVLRRRRTSDDAHDLRVAGGADAAA
jgi:hypothetical protein